MSVTLTNTLTNKQWIYQLPVSRPMTFGDMLPGDYSLVNETGNTLQVQIWGRTYSVMANSIWRFMLHSELQSIARQNLAAITPGQLLRVGLTGAPQGVPTAQDEADALAAALAAAPAQEAATGFKPEVVPRAKPEPKAEAEAEPERKAEAKNDKKAPEKKAETPPVTRTAHVEVTVTSPGPIRQVPRDPPKGGKR